MIPGSLLISVCNENKDSVLECGDALGNPPRRVRFQSWLRQNGVSSPENATKNELQSCVLWIEVTYRGMLLMRFCAKKAILLPYHSFFNAIELVRSVAKQHYNKTVASRSGHGLDGARAVWKESLGQVTAEIWRNEVKHAEEKIVKFYNDEVRGIPEVEELIINHGSNESEEEEEEEQEEGRTEEAEVLAVPL